MGNRQWAVAVGSRQCAVGNRQLGMPVILSEAENPALPLRCQLGPTRCHSERSEESRSARPEARHLTPETCSVILSAAKNPALASPGNPCVLGAVCARALALTRRHAECLDVPRTHEHVLRLHHGQQISHPLHGRDEQPRTKGARAPAQTRPRIHRTLQHRPAGLLRGLRYPRAAISWEKQLKGWTRLRKVALIESLNRDWKDLSDGWPGS